MSLSYRLSCLSARAKNDVQAARCDPSLGYTRDPKTGPLLCGLLWLVSLVIMVNAVGAENVVLVDDQGRRRASGQFDDGEPQVSLFTVDGHVGRERLTVKTTSLPAAEVGRSLPTRVRRNAHDLPRKPRVHLTTLATLQLFEQHCVACHGGDGRGVEATADFPTIPNFVDASWQRSRSDVELAASIVNGRGDGMPPFSEELTRSQVVAMVAHIRSLAHESVDRPGPRASEFARKYAELKQEWDSLARELAELQSHD